MNTIKSARDPSSSTIKLCQIGLANSDSVSNLITSYGSVFVNKYIASLTSLTGQRKRAVTALTCSQLNDLAGSLNQLSTEQLAAISLTNFYSCQTLLGLATNSWSTAQLTTLAASAKSVCSLFYIF